MLFRFSAFSGAEESDSESETEAEAEAEDAPSADAAEEEEASPEDGGFAPEDAALSLDASSSHLVSSTQEDEVSSQR